MSEELAEIAAVCKKAFPVFRFLDISKTHNEVKRYVKSFVTNPHVILFAHSPGGSLHIYTCKGSKVVPLQLDCAIASVVSLMLPHKCSTCLSDLSVSASIVYYGCPCGYCLCLECHPACEVGQECPCGGGPLQCNYETLEPHVHHKVAPGAMRRVLLDHVLALRNVARSLVLF